MTIVGGFDVHRQQITFDYVDTDTDTDTGRVWWGRSVRRRGIRCGPGWPITAPAGTPRSRWRAAPGGGTWWRS